jgi:tRNA(adenine34) deaminase
MTEEEENKQQLQKDEQYMRKALVEAEMARDAGEIPIGAIIVCKDRIISRAHNLTETLCDVTAHAEMQAITSAANALGGKYLTDCTLYVTVEPCTMCAGAIGWAQIKRIVYGAADEKRGYTRIAPNALHPKAVVTSGAYWKKNAARSCRHSSKIDDSLLKFPKYEFLIFQNFHT